MREPLLASLVAGAAVAAAAGALIGAGPAAREAVLVGTATGAGLAGATWLGLRGLAALAPRARLAPGAALGVGAALGAAPWAGVGAALALAAGSVWLGARLAPPVVAVRATAGGALAAVLVAGLLPPSLAPPRPADASAGAAAERPDLLLVSVDTLRADVLEGGCAPRLAALARSGTSAPYALAPSDTTLPSHVTMLSGVRALDHGVADNSGRMGAEVVLAPQRLRDAGYRTAAVVSNYLLRGEAGFARGFEVYDESPTVHAGPRSELGAHLAARTWWGWLGLETRAPAPLERLVFGRIRSADGGDRGNGRHTTDHALALLAELQRGAAPFFLFVHYMDPHTPYSPPPRAGCGPSGALPARYRNGHAPLADWRLATRVGRDLGDGRAEAPAALAHLQGLYAGEVAFIDRMLGELVDALERSPRRSAVLVTADHGEQFGEHGLLTHGNSLYEPALRVPFIVAGASVPAAGLESPPHLADVAPTLLGLAGLPVRDLAGRDVLAAPLPAEPHLARRSSLVAIRAGGWKLHLRLGADGTLAPVELYDLAGDAGELDDRLAARPDVAERLARRAEAAFAARSRADAPREPGPDHHRALEALGYVED